MNVATPQIFEVERHIQKNVQAFLNADRPDVTDQVRLAKFQSGIGLNGFKGLEIGTVSNNENIARIHPSPGYSKVSVAGICGHDYVTETVRLLFEPDLGPIKEVFSFILGEIEFRVRIVMIEDVFHAQEFEGEGDQKDIVGGITALNDLESVPNINPPSVKELPKQCAAKFEEIPEGAVPFSWHRVPIDVYPIENFVARSVALTSGAQHGHAISVRAQGQGFLPYA
jgi:hypothetical protein